MLQRLLTKNPDLTNFTHLCFAEDKEREIVYRAVAYLFQIDDPINP